MASMWRVSLLLAAVSLWCGCATVHIDPALYQAKTIAVASIFARKNIDFDNLAVAPTLLDNDYGAEVLEMELGDAEARLSEIFGVEVMPAGKAMQAKAYRDLPESAPSEDWTRVNDMIAVDVDNPTAAAALGELALSLGVDAVIVVRHEWALSRARFDPGTESVTAFDKCSLLVVDKGGRKLWDDVVISRIPGDSISAGAFVVGLNGGTWADEARQLARRASREALDNIARRYRDARGKKP